jgi:hypothetical protein
MYVPCAEDGGSLVLNQLHLILLIVIALLTIAKLLLDLIKQQRK